jgi:hypothetical protein
MTSKEQAEQILRQLGPVPNGKTWGQHLVDHILASAASQAKDQTDWKEQYEYQKRRAEMWIAKYEKDIGPLEKVAPQGEQQ